MGDISFSTTDDDESDEEQSQASSSTSTSRRYKKISMTGCVLFLKARDAPTPVDQYVWKFIKSQVKLTNCILALRVVNASNVDVGSSKGEVKEMKSSEVGNEVRDVGFNVCLLDVGYWGLNVRM
uniref:Uncharacterized protein n=1 Tax=Tanacetum cinerariifolium TaxID=118510 RepID=A0A6L2N7N0_TANCI|nr:hypothetical protein [Tanacetum cinerariifolium]